MIVRFTEKLGSAGAIIAAMGCAACFPALGSLGAAIGLGFLSAYEGLFINTLLPLFAAIALLSNLFLWWQHAVHWRGALSLLGPVMILATLYPLWQYEWSTWLFYAGLVLMFVISLWDILVPARMACTPQQASQL